MPHQQSQYETQLLNEIRNTPAEYHPNLLMMVRLFRESVTLKPAEASFNQGWREVRTEQTQPLAQLWEGIDTE